MSSHRRLPICLILATAAIGQTPFDKSQHQVRSLATPYSLSSGSGELTLTIAADPTYGARLASAGHVSTTGTNRTFTYDCECPLDTTTYLGKNRGLWMLRLADTTQGYASTDLYPNGAFLFYAPAGSDPSVILSRSNVTSALGSFWVEIKVAAANEPHYPDGHPSPEVRNALAISTVVESRQSAGARTMELPPIKAGFDVSGSELLPGDQRIPPT